MAMVPCPKCGEKISDAAKFCIYCGEVMKEAPAKPAEPAKPSTPAQSSTTSTTSSQSWFQQQQQKVAGAAPASTYYEPAPAPDSSSYDEDDVVIEENERWFKFYVILPKAAAIITAILFFIWSIVDVSVFQYTTYTGYYVSREVTYYGSMMIKESAFLALLIWWIIGAVDCVITYIVLKLTTCYQILHIYNLKKIRENTRRK